MLVTDAMPPGGTSGSGFHADGHAHHRGGWRLPGAGRHAGRIGAEHDAAFNNTISMLGQDLVTASRMASGNPARFLRLEHETGSIAPGLRADLVHLDEARTSPRHGSRGARGSRMMPDLGLVDGVSGASGARKSAAMW
jgi:N-acetylglucosamine-6-phosphate deacetylase